MRQFSFAVCAVLVSLVAGCPPEEEGTGDGGTTKPPESCGTVTCAAGQVCCNPSCGICTEPGGSCTEQFCGEPVSNACAGVRCGEGTHCEVPACEKEPCEATCVPDQVYGCELIDCKPGYICREDAKGQGSCVPEDSGVACGKATCAAGQVCCNASCGICTAPDAACIQVACEGEPNPTCDLKCDAGSHCELQEVQCFAPPCNPVPACVKDAECTGPIIDCAAPPENCHYEGGGCVDGKWTCGKLTCVSEEPTSCAAALCPIGTYCDDISGHAKCIKLPSCDGVSCEAGQHCELKDVQCVRAPCPPQPMCVKDATCKDPCSTARCGSGTHCEAKQVQCIKAPCCPVAECVADTKDVPCGKNTCTDGNVCCNASCGICTPPGRVCIQIACN